MMEKRNVATSRREVADDDDAEMDAAVSLFDGSKKASSRRREARSDEDEAADEDTLSGSGSMRG